MDHTISSALLLGQSATSSFERQAKSLIQASEANIAHIDSQIRDLLRLREQERGLITALKLVIAPIRKLPAELLVEIFLEYACWIGSSIKAALVICGVCAHWRQLACTTPQLWTGILPRKIVTSSSAESPPVAKTFLERSAPLPIPIFLRNGIVTKVAERVALPIVDLLFSLAPRWQSLTLHDIDFPLSQLRRLPLNTFQNLESVDLKIHAAIPAYETKVKVFLGAPRLRDVTLFVRDTNHFPMPWSQLTRLTVEEHSSQICLDILLQCTNIVFAKFTDMHSWHDPPISGPIITLPRLEELEVRFEMSHLGGHIMPLFMRLDLPALKDLTIKPDLGDIWSSVDFTGFQRRSRNIQHLTIENCSFSSTDLICVLLEAPNLVRLHMELCMYCIDDSVFELLQHSDLDTAHPVPRLRQLYVDHAGRDFQESSLEDMIQSRWWSDRQLLALPAPPPVERWENIHIWCGDDDPIVFSERFKSEMDQLQTEGLKLDIS
ncbi:hypothetical protein C8R44DRAFT_789015 [Mycena epipterygia]|nr:hypothetical protein C8R44DRAFT_789015 [Mycena epipterygia]